MRRVGDLWAGLVSFENLLRAARQSARGKRFRGAVLTFHARLGSNLWRLHEQLCGHAWRPGPFREFTTHDPKTRLTFSGGSTCGPFVASGVLSWHRSGGVNGTPWK
jgi:hypothetical protein